MKETMRIAVAHALVGVLVFIAALVFFNYRISAEKGNPVTELQNSLIPHRKPHCRAKAQRREQKDGKREEIGGQVLRYGGVEQDG